MGIGTGAGTEWKCERGRGWRLVDEHRMGTGTGAGMETRVVVEMGTGTKMRTWMKMGTGSDRVEAT